MKLVNHKRPCLGRNKKRQQTRSGTSCCSARKIKLWRMTWKTHQSPAWGKPHLIKAWVSTLTLFLVLNYPQAFHHIRELKEQTAFQTDVFLPGKRLRDQHNRELYFPVLPLLQSPDSDLYPTQSHSISLGQAYSKESKRRARKEPRCFALPLCPICSSGVHQRLAFPALSRRRGSGRQPLISFHRYKNATKWRPRSIA